jgi:hypothetical protein
MKIWLLGLSSLLCALFIFAPSSSSATRIIQSPTSAPQSSAPASSTPQPIAATAPSESLPKITAYTLPPDLYRKAHLLGQIAFWGRLGVFV